MTDRPFDTDFTRELTSAINRHSKESGSDTPDFILADFLDHCLQAFNVACTRRKHWYEGDPIPVAAPESEPKSGEPLERGPTYHHPQPNPFLKAQPEPKQREYWWSRLKYHAVFDSKVLDSCIQLVPKRELDETKLEFLRVTGELAERLSQKQSELEAAKVRYRPLSDEELAKRFPIPFNEPSWKDTRRAICNAILSAMQVEPKVLTDDELREVYLKTVSIAGTPPLRGFYDAIKALEAK